MSDDMYKNENQSYLTDYHQVYAKLMKNGAKPTIIKINKSNQESDEFRVTGNKYYAAGNYDIALLNYNKAICFAKPGSETLALSYGNRSAVYFTMKLFKDSLENIKLAKENNYPQRQIEKLLQRQELCLQKINDVQDNSGGTAMDFELKLSYPACPQNPPHIVDGLYIKDDPNCGRGIFTKIDLKAGDIVIMDEPIAFALENLYLQRRCSFCFKMNNGNLIPCRECTCAMYCSTECYEKAFEEFHKFECSTIDGIYELCGPNAATLYQVRALWVALKAFNDMNELKNFFMILKNKRPQTSDLDFVNKSPKNLLKLLMALKGNDHLEASRRVHEAFSKMMCIFILENENVRDKFRSAEQKDFYTKMMYHFAALQDVNGFGAYASDTKALIASDVMSSLALSYKFGGGIYPFTSYLNHSCHPNVDRVHKGKQMIVFVNRPIKKGEQLFIAYGKTFTSDLKEHRQKYLKLKSGFNCSCEACKKNYVPVPINPILLEANNLTDLLESNTQTRSYRAEIIKIGRFLNTPQARNPCLASIMGVVLLKFIGIAKGDY